MAKQGQQMALVSAKNFIRHINSFSATFSCPCCGSKKWGTQTLSIDPNFVDNRDGGNPDLEMVYPRALPDVVPAGLDYDAPILQTLTATCQVCGYIAMFDATIVQRVLDDERKS